MKKVLILPGSNSIGLGEMIASILESVTGDLDIECEYLDEAQSFESRTYSSSAALENASDADALIIGAFGNQNDGRRKGWVRHLKQQLNLHTYVREFYPLSDDKGDIDVLLISENADVTLNVSETESLEGVSTKKFVSSNNCKKMLAKGVEFAERGNRRQMTCVHNKSMNPFSDRMFVDVFYREMTGSNFMVNDMDIESAMMGLVRNPNGYNVILSPERYKEAFNGVLSGLIFDGHLPPKGSIGDRMGLFEPASMPTIGVEDKPSLDLVSSALSISMALDYLGMTKEGACVKKATMKVRNSLRPSRSKESLTIENFTGMVLNEINSIMG